MSLSKPLRKRWSGITVPRSYIVKQYSDPWAKSSVHARGRALGEISEDDIERKILPMLNKGAIPMRLEHHDYTRPLGRVQRAYRSKEGDVLIDFEIDDKEERGRALLEYMNDETIQSRLPVFMQLSLNHRNLGDKEGFEIDGINEVSVCMEGFRSGSKIINQTNPADYIPQVTLPDDIPASSFAASRLTIMSTTTLQPAAAPAAPTGEKFVAFNTKNGPVSFPTKQDKAAAATAPATAPATVPAATPASATSPNQPQAATDPAQPVPMDASAANQQPSANTVPGTQSEADSAMSDIAAVNPNSVIAPLIDAVQVFAAAAPDQLNTEAFQLHLQTAAERAAQQEAENKQLKRQLDEYNKERLDNTRQNYEIGLQILRKFVGDSDRAEFDSKLQQLSTEAAQTPATSVQELEKRYTERLGESAFAASKELFQKFQAGEVNMEPAAPAPEPEDGNNYFRNLLQTNGAEAALGAGITTSAGNVPASDFNASIRVTNVRGSSNRSSQPWNQTPGFAQFQKQQQFAANGDATMTEATAEYAAHMQSQQQQPIQPPPVSGQKRTNWMLNMSKVLADIAKQPGAPRAQPSPFSSAAQAYGSRQPGESTLDAFARNMQMQHQQQQYAAPQQPYGAGGGIHPAMYVANRPLGMGVDQYLPQQQQMHNPVDVTSMKASLLANGLPYSNQSWAERLCHDPENTPGLALKGMSPFTMKGYVREELLNGNRYRHDNAQTQETIKEIEGRRKQIQANLSGARHPSHAMASAYVR